LSQLKKYHPSGKLKFITFQSLKFRILMGKIPRISLKLNFSPNTLVSYGLSQVGSCHKRQKPQAPTPQAPIRNRQSVTAKREKSQTPKVLTATLTLPNLT